MPEKDSEMSYLRLLPIPLAIPLALKLMWVFSAKLGFLDAQFILPGPTSATPVIDFFSSRL